MKKIILITLGLLIASSSFARSSGGGAHHGAHSYSGHTTPVHVNGYIRRDGTYVEPHYRTSPDATKTNNWSHVGNVNPYTGKVGTNTDSSPNYGQTNGYYNPGYRAPLPTHYINNGSELHNSRNPTAYMD